MVKWFLSDLLSKDTYSAMQRIILKGTNKECSKK